MVLFHWGPNIYTSSRENKPRSNHRYPSFLANKTVKIEKDRRLGENEETQERSYIASGKVYWKALSEALQELAQSVEGRVNM